jgi:hypothetical protein
VSERVVCNVIDSSEETGREGLIVNEGLAQGGEEERKKST